MDNRWRNALPRPIAFVLSGGASLGAIQVGMLRALARTGLSPDLVVGASVGAINGAVVADQELGNAVSILEEIWLGLSRQDVFPGGILAQVRQLLTTRLSLFPQAALADLICRSLSVNSFEQLRLPFGVLATELLTQHGTLFTSGAIRLAILASSAIPGIYPPVDINGLLYVDGALTAHVPLRSAMQMGAASLVVLDAGNTCHRRRPPRHIAEMVAITMHAALRQRVLVEVPLVAAKMPLLYLPTPCPVTRSLVDFDQTADLITQATAITKVFLDEAAVPVPGAMSGSPHFHDEDLPHNVRLASASQAIHKPNTSQR